MTSYLSRITSTRRTRPPRIVLYGPHGIGKSTFGANAPNPIFICAEEGLDAIDAQAFPTVQTVAEVEQAITALLNEQHDFSTVVVDSLDWLENVIWRQVATSQGKSNIEDIGYGKGYKIAIDTWRKLLDGFDALRNTRGMGIVLLAHCKVKRFEDPTADPYDRYQLDLHDSASAVVQEWADVVGFANYRIHVKTTDVGFNTKVRRAVGGQDRLIYFHERPAFQAKTRYALPEELPLQWDAFAAAFAAATNQPVAKTTATK